MQLRFLTWNIHSCVGTDRKYDPGRIADVLLKANADVIGLQEVDWRSPSHEGSDQFSYLAKRLDMTAIAGPNLRDHRGHYGNGLLTRLDVNSVARIDLAYRNVEPRGAIDASLGGNEDPIRVIVTHLGLTRRERLTQRRVLAEHLDNLQEGERRILLGDMNEWHAMRRSDNPLVPRHFEHRHSARTFPSTFPLLRLDRAFIAPAPAGVRVSVIRSQKARRASDHLPLLVEVDWKRT